MAWVYLFEAKGIQNYILDSGKLRDVVGASELVDSLCRYQERDIEQALKHVDAPFLKKALERPRSRDLLSYALEAVGLADPELFRFSRRAGAAFELHAQEPEPLERFRAFWGFVVGQFAPCLEYEDSLRGGDAWPPMKAAGKARKHKAKRAVRKNGLATLLPVAGPLVKRSQRTGMPAVMTEYEEVIDRTTSCKRALGEATALTSRFAPDDSERHWPINLGLEEDDPVPDGRKMSAEQKREREQKYFPFKGDRRIVGVIHADGNNMGGTLSELDRTVQSQQPEQALAKVLAFSIAIEEAAVGAARKATEQVLDRARDDLKRMPARPTVLGGDDLTVIVRGDLAVPFTRVFLEEFERLSECFVRQVFPNEHELHRMTACAGIAFVPANHPFYLSYRLAEELCRAAKTGSRSESSVAFHRVTASVIDDYDTIREAELTLPKTSAPGESFTLTRQPYAVGKQGAFLPRLEHIECLCKHLKKSEGRGALREFWSLLYADQSEAQRAYENWRRQREKEQSQLTDSKWLEEYNRRLGELLDGTCQDGLPFDADGNTPIGDALALLEVG